ncbi:MAG: DUF2520 domain-containing protein [Bacteroidales bacterium]|nr:DUF2520 domain-containing protein [Bacteroidales bacterium]
MPINEPTPELPPDFPARKPLQNTPVRSVTVVGCGNVASWLVFALKKAKIPVSQIYGRNPDRCRKLAETCGAKAVCQWEDLQSTSDLYIFSVKDDAYEEMIPQFPFRMPLAVLTAGTLSQNLLAPAADRYGVLYPCQTLTTGMDFSNLQVPLCVEGNDEQTTGILARFASQLSDNVHFLNEEQRRHLHLAAVFASNFSNAMYIASADLLGRANIDFSVLQPLIQNTLDKLKRFTPKESQTGPAARRDDSVMSRHLQMLPENDLREIYQIVSQYIMNQTNKES